MSKGRPPAVKLASIAAHSGTGKQAVPDLMSSLEDVSIVRLTDEASAAIQTHVGIARARAAITTPDANSPLFILGIAALLLWSEPTRQTP
jgi:hypothetical protein